MTPQGLQQLQGLYQVAQAGRQGANPSMVVPEQKQSAIRRIMPDGLEQQHPNQAAQMAALYQMYAANTPQGDTYRNPMALAARAMSANNQEVTPGTSNNGGMPVMGGPVAPGLPQAIQPQVQMPQFAAMPLQLMRAYGPGGGQR